MRYEENKRNPGIKAEKTILHDGEVELAQSMPPWHAFHSTSFSCFVLPTSQHPRTSGDLHDVLSVLRHTVLLMRLQPDLACEVCMQVNKIREVPQHPHIVVTHTDKPQLYVWNLETQPNRASDKATLPVLFSNADLALLTAGHVWLCLHCSSFWKALIGLFGHCLASQAARKLCMST